MIVSHEKIEMKYLIDRQLLKVCIDQIPISGSFIHVIPGSIINYFIFTNTKAFVPFQFPEENQTVS